MKNSRDFDIRVGNYYYLLGQMYQKQEELLEEALNCFDYAYKLWNLSQVS